MNSRAIVTTKGQVTIPKPVRDQLGIGDADIVEFEVKRGEAVLRPVQRSFLSRFASIPPSRRPESWKQVRRRVAKDVARRIAGRRRG
ncbi:MAG: AbrB/MazE/SpoVT family DNA-binding domain-containing protein [Armatimonadetes bacterium]|nr:AbrB/MazE/SpoVT family DNA-binding domain-containing protein [Armatimonadota bacterium]MBI2973333.1 AbrB/MazE/SpoVT family DNA-binding domain-containing protein [Armatimonadota bacterium]